MLKTSLGLKKIRPIVVTNKKLNVQGHEEEFLDYWKSLGFRKEKDKNSKSYTNSIKSLRKVLSGEPPWEGITLSRLKVYCEILKVYSESNRPHNLPEGEKFIEPGKLYFHQFVKTYSGYSYLKAIMSGKIRGEVISEDTKVFAADISKILYARLTRKAFSSGECSRINRFAQAISCFCEDRKEKIAFGVDRLTIVKGIFQVVDDFRATKSIPPGVLIYTGNYAAGAALEQAMERFGYWKIYSKLETPEMALQKDPEKVKRIMEQKKAKEEEDLPEIVKRRREELKKRGIEIKKQDQEDCSRKEEYLKNKKKPWKSAFVRQ